MLNSMKSLLVGDEVIEIIASLMPGTESIAHCPGSCSKSLPPFGASTRKVLTSGVCSVILVTMPA